MEMSYWYTYCKHVLIHNCNRVVRLKSEARCSVCKLSNELSYSFLKHDSHFITNKLKMIYTSSGEQL